MPGVSTVEDILCPRTPEGHDQAILIAWGSLAIESELKKCRLNMDSRGLMQLLCGGYY
jgi:hypothetical protein